MKKYEKRIELTDEAYGKAALEAARKMLFGHAGEFAEKIRNKKLKNDMYGRLALEAARRQGFGYAGELAKKGKKWIVPKGFGTTNLSHEPICQ